MTIKEALAKLKFYIRPHLWRIVLSVVASWLVAGCDGAMAKLVQPFVDKLIVARDEQMMIFVPLFIITLQVVKAVSRYVQEYFIKTAGQLAIQKIRNDIYEHSMQLSMRYHTKTSTGVMMSRVLNDVQALQGAMGELLIGVMRDAVTLVVLIGVAFYTDWKMAAIAFISLPLAAWPVSRISRKIKSHTKRSYGGLGQLTVALEQSYSGIKVIKAFGAEKQEIGRFRKENSNYYNILKKIYKYDAASSPFIEIMTGIGSAAVIWFGMQRVLSGDMSQGQLFSVVTAIMLMYAPFKRLTKMNNYLVMATSAAESVFNFLEERVEIKDAPDAVELTGVNGEVVFDHVSFAYDKSPVLVDCNLQASPGEVIALVGPSGAGKTTMVALLSRFYDPTAGRILIDGHDIRNVTVDSLKQYMSIVDQESFLFNTTILENIRYSRQGASVEEVKEAARQAYAEDFILTLPQRYNTEIGDRGLRLSGGQRQRICIARALLRNAPILILDEATSALDTESESMVQQALDNLMKNRTTFVIAHRLSTIMHAHKIVVMEAGRIVQIGRHNELLAQGGLYKKLYDMQFKEM